MEEHHVVAAILRRADQVLLCHRSPRRRWYPDVWDFPGGHVEPGERPEDALRREVAEELGAATVTARPAQERTRTPSSGLGSPEVCSDSPGQSDNFCSPRPLLTHKR
jgi:8-oxo-dGTP pyrophosphatase MutT (NUDIX family)